MSRASWLPTISLPASGELAARSSALAVARRFAFAEGAEFALETGDAHGAAVATLWLARGDA